jgi:hypothetical protein
MVTVRDFRAGDAPVLWTLSTLPNIGGTADPDAPLTLPAAASPPVREFADLADVPGRFAGAGALGGAAPRSGAARTLGYGEVFLDTATNMPEAMAFYAALGYREVGRETRPEWSWTLVYYVKALAGD